MNYYERHLGDYARDAAHLTMLEHGAYTLLLDRYYTTEHGIPADQVHRICRARAREEKAAVDAVLAEFFTLEDGAWINGRAEREIAGFLAAAPDREAKKENARERQRRTRERRKQLFDALRELGVVPDFDVSTTELQAMLSRTQKRTVTPPVTQPVTRDATATQTPDPSHQTPEDKVGEFSATVAPAASLPTEPRAGPAEDPPPAPSLASRACLALRGANVHDVNPSHPDLLRLLAAGVTPEEIGATAAECAAKGKARFAYVLATVDRRRTEAASRGQAAAPAAVDPMAWADSRSQVIATALRLGLEPFEELNRTTGHANSWPAYLRRVVDAWQGANTGATA